MYNGQYTEIFLNAENEMINLFNTVLEQTDHDEEGTKEIINSAVESAFEQFYETYYK